MSGHPARTSTAESAKRSSEKKNVIRRGTAAGTVLFYKFPQLNREELERMFNLAAIKDTAVYREAFSEGEVEGERRGEREGKREGKREGEREGEREGKLNAVPLLLELGATEERIAAELGLDLQAVRQAAARARSQLRGSRKARSRRSPKTTE